MKAEIEIYLSDMHEFLELMDNMYEGLDRIQKESMDTSARFWAGRMKARIEGFCGQDNSKSIQG